MPREWKQVAGVDHPTTVYLRERSVLPALDDWLARLFAPEQLDETIAALLAARDIDEAATARAEAAHRSLDDCAARLSRYRAAIEDGVDARIVAPWIAEVEGARLTAEQVLAEFDAARVDEADLRAAVAAVDVAAMLNNADPDDKAALYADLGLTLTYQPTERTVLAEARPVYVARVGGGTCRSALRHPPCQHGESHGVS